MRRFPRKLSEVEERSISLFYAEFEPGVSKRALLAEYFSIANYNDITLYESYVLRVVRQYDFAIKRFQHKNGRYWRGIFNKKDPRKDKRKWGIFVALASQMLELGISAKTYFYYCMKVRKKKTFEYYYLNSPMIMIEFNTWFDKNKNDGINLDKSITYTNVATLKRRLILAQKKLNDHMKILGCGSERDYWLSLLPAWITEYPLEFLRRNRVYKKLYSEGEMAGPAFPNPFTGEVKNEI